MLPLYIVNLEGDLMTNYQKYTVSFFGHREIDNVSDIWKKLDDAVGDLITHKNYVEFLVGREGEFDRFASEAVKRAQNKYGNINNSLVLILPYMKAEYRDNKQSYLEYFDDVEICSEASEAHFKQAIRIRNRNMVDRSDLVICCIQHKNGGAYQTVKYALAQNRPIMQLGDLDITEK